MEKSNKEVLNRFQAELDNIYISKDGNIERSVLEHIEDIQQRYIIEVTGIIKRTCQKKMDELMGVFAETYPRPNIKK